MCNTESRPTLRRIGRRLWRIGKRLYYTHTHTPIVEESALESVLELADYSSESADSNADPEKIGVWVRALSLVTTVLSLLDGFMSIYLVFPIFMVILFLEHQCDTMSSDFWPFIYDGILCPLKVRQHRSMGD